jgi:serine/threonine protein kinase
VLYELATGTAPFAGETTAIVFGRLLNEQPTPLRELNAALPAEFEPIVQKALEKDPAFRYQTARDLHVDLKRLQRGTAAGTEPRTAVPVPRAPPENGRSCCSSSCRCSSWRS